MATDQLRIGAGGGIAAHGQLRQSHAGFPRGRRAPHLGGLERAVDRARAYQEDVNGLATTASSRRTDRERQLNAVERKIWAIMEAVEKGLYAPSVNDRMQQLEAERKTLQKAEEAVETPRPA